MSWELRRHPRFPGVPGPVVACILDGVGLGRHDDSDAVWLARTPHLDWLAAQPLSTALLAHGTAVGMPSDADMGNSEVGHNALGAGRIFDQGAKLVSAAIADGRLYRGPVWQKLCERVRASGEPLHFIGLLSDGNVHSHIDHLFAMLRRCDEEEVARVRLHVLLDGRDVPERSALRYVDALEELLESLSRKPGTRLPHRLGRGAHARDHGPLRGRLEHRRARLAGPRARRGACLLQRPRGHRHLLRRGSERGRPAAAGLRDRRRGGPGGGRSATGRRWCSSTSGATAPWSWRAPSRTTTSRASSGGSARTCSSRA